MAAQITAQSDYNTERVNNDSEVMYKTDPTVMKLSTYIWNSIY